MYAAISYAGSVGQLVKSSEAIFGIAEDQIFPTLTRCLQTNNYA